MMKDVMAVEKWLNSFVSRLFTFFKKAQNVYIESVILFYEYLLDLAKTRHSSFTLLTKCFVIEFLCVVFLMFLN